MKDLFKFLILTLCGVGIGLVTGINPLEQSFFPLFAATALVCGLYVSVAGIDVEALGKYRKTALLIVTIGVPVQIFLTGGLMWLIYPAAVSFLAAVAIDQIDPLSVNTLLQNKQGMSKEAKALLRVWASFDDPVTVLVGFVFLVPLVQGFQSGSFLGYLAGLGVNILPAILLYGIYKYGIFEKYKFIEILTLAFSVLFAVYFQAYLFAAIIGLFVRPFGADKLSEYINFVYYAVIILVGAAVVHYGVDLRLGFLLAIVEFFVVQPLSAIAMVRGTTNDIFRLAFAQQNGLTTILMGLAFQAMGFEIIHILLPAIIFINTFNLVINGFYSWKQDKGWLVSDANFAANNTPQGKVLDQI